MRSRGLGALAGQGRTLHGVSGQCCSTRYTVGQVQHAETVVASTPSHDRPTLVAVDGIDGSGKTTFAATLEAAYLASGRPVHVVHLDDFLNPKSVRYRLGRDSPEGYFLDSYDLRGLTRWVLEPLGVGGHRRIRSRVFDHRSDAPCEDDPVLVAPDAVVIVEGLFLHRDELVGRWDVSVFLDVPFSVSVGRMAARDGTDPDPAHPSVARYVDGQRIYLARCCPKERATVVIDNA